MTLSREQLSDNFDNLREQVSKGECSIGPETNIMAHDAAQRTALDDKDQEIARLQGEVKRWIGHHDEQVRIKRNIHDMYDKAHKEIARLLDDKESHVQRIINDGDEIQQLEQQLAEARARVKELENDRPISQ